MFVCFSPQISTTATFKYQKVQLRKDNFDPSKAGGDALYYYDSRSQKFEPLNIDAYKKIMNCKMYF